MRRSEREIKEIDELLHVADQCKIARIGMIDEQGIYVVPVNFGYEYVDDKMVIYIHGAKEGRKMDAIKQRPDVCVEMDCHGEIIEGDNACQYTNLFASIIGNGKAQVIEDMEEKKRALTIFMKHQTGKEFAFTEKMAGSVAVIKIVLDSFVGKHHE